MDARIKQVVLEMLRLGEKPEEVRESLLHAGRLLNELHDYQPNHDMADFHRAYKDADFRP
jgi:hypothetical protein